MSVDRGQRFMSLDRGQRLVDYSLGAQAMGAATVFGLGGSWSLSPISGEQLRELVRIDQQMPPLKTALSEIQLTGRHVETQLRDEYFSTLRSLGDHEPLPTDLKTGSTLGTRPTLGHTELGGHESMGVIRSSLNTIERNHEFDLNHAANSSGRQNPMSRLTELRFSEGMKVSPEGLRYNRLVGQFNQCLDDVHSQNAEVRRANAPSIRNATVATFGAIAVDHVLDYTLLRDRTWSGASFLTDIASPLVSSWLVHKLGPAPAFIGPVLAHVAEKYLIEEATDSQGMVLRKG
jgi:hypothetical protein